MTYEQNMGFTVRLVLSQQVVYKSGHPLLDLGVAFGLHRPPHVSQVRRSLDPGMQLPQLEGGESDEMLHLFHPLDDLAHGGRRVHGGVNDLCYATGGLHRPSVGRGVDGAGELQSFEALSQ